MASIDETDSRVAGVTAHGQLWTLHRGGDAAGAATPRPTPSRAGSTTTPARATTRGKAKGATPPASHEDAARKGNQHHSANRAFVVGNDGRPLDPCTVQRARKLRRAGRARLYSPNPYTIRITDRHRDDGRTQVQKTEVRVDPGSRHTGIAVVMLLENEDRVVYQEEVHHRPNISTRLLERKGHRRRRRGQKWFRAPRFDNRTRSSEWLPPSIESIVSNQFHRTTRLARAAGATHVVVETARFDTQKALRPDISGTEYQHGPLYETHRRAYVAARDEHQCVYCGKGDWTTTTRFEVDHIVPRSKGGATNVRNLVWSCRPCNQRKSAKDVREFLKTDPTRLAKVLKNRGVPLACAGQQAVICAALTRRLRGAGMRLRETTGADTTAHRKGCGIPKTHANDAACAGSASPVRQLRQPASLTAQGHGRRKQIKGLPIGRYLAWVHQTQHPKSESGAVPRANTPQHRGNRNR